MEKRKYELTVVFDGQLEQTVVDEKVEELNKLMKDSKCEVIQQDDLGKRRLAYEIMKRQYGYYIYFLFESDGNSIKDVENNLKLNENVLRYLTVKLDKKALTHVDKKTAEVQTKVQEKEVIPKEDDSEKQVDKEAVVD